MEVHSPLGTVLRPGLSQEELRAIHESRVQRQMLGATRTTRTWRGPAAQASSLAVYRAQRLTLPDNRDNYVLYPNAHTSMGASDIREPKEGQGRMGQGRIPQDTGRRLAGAAAATPVLASVISKIVSETVALQAPPRARKLEAQQTHPRDYQREARASSAETRQQPQALDKDTQIELVMNMNMREIEGKEEVFLKTVAISVAVAVKGIVSKVLPLQLEPGL
jgi:hypothetical protein